MVSDVFRIPLDVPQRTSHRCQRHGTQRWLPLREYISGPENALASLAVQAMERWCELSVDQNPYNPIYLYGPSGTGKTELIRKLAEVWRRFHAEHRVIVTTAADFIHGFASAAKREAVPDWLSHFNCASMLVIDNVNQLDRKFSTQQLLVRLIDEFLQQNRPVLLTGSSPPSGHAGLLPRLASRLSSGLTIPLLPPGVDARCEIVQELLSARGVRCTPAAVRYAATHIQGTFLKLQSTLQRLLSTKRAHVSRIDEADFRRILHRKNDQPPSVSPELVIRTVARYYQMPLTQLTGPSRRVSTVHARRVAVYMIRKLTNCSFKRIGAYLGRRDHSTVLHAYRKTESLLQRDATMRLAIAELHEMLPGS